MNTRWTGRLTLAALAALVMLLPGCVAGKPLCVICCACLPPYGSPVKATDTSKTTDKSKDIQKK